MYADLNSLARNGALFCSVQAEIFAQSSLYPNKTAVVCNDVQISYGELELKSNALAALLQSKGIGPGKQVAFLLEPGIDLIITLLGVQKSGAAYVPLSPTYPEARIHSILQSSACSTILCDEKNRDIASKITTRPIILDEGVFSPHEQSAEFHPHCDPEALAYILYTSGSTGVPKGVKILNRNVSYYVAWCTAFFKKSIANRIPLTSSIQFAAAVSQIYSCLAARETLHILPGYLNQPEKLFDWYAKHPEYGLQCVPSVWNASLDWLHKKNIHQAKGPAALFLSGEDIPARLIDDTFRRFPDIRIWNLYGPTEAVANLSCKQITNSGEITIGRPLPGTAFYVVKENGSEAHDGEEGALYASGPGICDGYVGEDRLTDTVLFDYMSERDGLVRIYDTGDSVRRTNGGEYTFTGRRDQQVKVHGHRIELAEIENRLHSHMDVLAASVCLVEGDRPYIAAYIQSRHGQNIPVGELRRHLRLFLTEIMTPERWIFIDEFPKLANGKIDRKALPVPDGVRPELGYDFVQALEDREQKIANAFGKVLGIWKVGMNDNFFDLGGNSLKALRLLVEIEEQLHFRPDFSTLFTHPTPGALLNTIPVSSSVNAPLNRQPLLDTDIIPLTVSQNGLWFFLQVHPDNGVYNIAYSIGIDGELDVRRLRKALEQVVCHHLPLHCVLRKEGDTPYFAPDNNFQVQLPVECLDMIPEDQREGFVTESITNLASRPLQLYDKPLHRCRLYRINDQRHVLAWVVSHLVSDGESTKVFMKDLAAFYKGVPPASSAISFADVVQRRKEYATGDQYDRDRSFWKEYLDGVTGLHAFPVIYKQTSPLPFSGRRVSTVIDGDLRNSLSLLCREKGLTLNMILLAAFAVALYKFGEREEYVIASPFANRLDKADGSLIGYFVNTLLYRLHCSPGLRFGDLVDNVRKDTIQILDHQQLPFDELANILRQQGVNLPLSAFKILFAFHETSEWTEAGGGIRMNADEVFNRQAKCDLHLECFDNLKTIALEFTYGLDALDEQAALQVVSVFTQLLQEITEHYDTDIDALADILPVEREEVLRCSVGANMDYAKAGTLFGLFKESCRDFTDLPAISFRDQSITYSILEKNVASCISCLADLSLDEREPLGIYMDHTPEMVIAILGASALGHPYVPLDPAYPEARNRYIAGHAGIRFVLTTSGLHTETFDEEMQLVFIDEVIARAQESVRINSGQPAPEDLLYIIYTSGSTGNPKGVMVPNKGVVNYLLWMKRCFATGTDTRILAKTSISFDISVWELFLPLISGGTLVLEKRADIESPEQIARVIREKQVNIFQFVPSGLKLFTDAGMFAQTPCLKQIFCGGEKLPVRLQDEVLSKYSGELYNLYGPTEASIFMCYYRCTPGSGYENVPVGMPIQNSSVYVLDKDLKLLPRNMPGDLYIGGYVLADGYWKDPEKTQKVFIQSPAELPETALYATGDRGRMLSDGNIEFLGRKDYQVKIRGYRVELHEIEKAIEHFFDIRQAVVYKSEHAEDDARLHAVAVPVNGTAVDSEVVRAGLRSKLPSYMIPATITLVNDIPLLPNGKINLKEISKKKTGNASASPLKEVVRNRGNIEEVLSSIWSEVIGQEGFTLTDNFFDVGGHSLLFLKIRDKIRDRLGTDFSIVELYQYPNIAALADQYRKKYGGVPPTATISAIRNRIARRKNRKHGKQ